jgi:hypothetical protein
MSWSTDSGSMHTYVSPLGDLCQSAFQRAQVVSWLRYLGCFVQLKGMYNIDWSRSESHSCRSCLSTSHLQTTNLEAKTPI